MNAAAVLTEVAPAKLNLALHVRARRADGYHELETLFVFARDGDLLTLAPGDAPSFVVEGERARAWATYVKPSVMTLGDARRAYVGATTALVVIPHDGKDAWRQLVAEVAWTTLCHPPFPPDGEDD